MASRATGSVFKSESDQTVKDSKSQLKNVFFYIFVVLSIATASTTAFLFLGADSGAQKPSPSATQTVKDTGLSAAVELREVVDASVAEMGTNGWVQENTESGKRVFYNPSYTGEYQVAAKASADGVPFVEGSMFEVVPFELMEKLETTPADIKVSKSGDVFTVKNVDTVANGTAFTEYKVENGLIVSKTIRDRVGKKNELRDVTVCHYGLDKTAIADLEYANTHQPAPGHD